MPGKVTSEMLTPVLADPPSIISFIVTIGAAPARPANTARLTAIIVASYEVTPEAIAEVCRTLGL